MKFIYILVFSLQISSELIAQTAGPYAPPVGQNGSLAIHKDSSIFVGWATSATIDRGWQNISNTAVGKTTAGDSLSPTDKSGINGVVSLGDNGSATLTFDGVIKDGPGADFAVFENSFDGLFLELAFVEVSSDGVNFFRFDAVSLTDTTTQTNSFGNTDATDIYNLAGKYQAQYGTPFDLNELAGTPGLDIDNVTHVRVIDVIGNIAEPFATYDSQNYAINDPWPTEFPTGGFDLDAVGVINFTPTSIHDLSNNIQLNVYPNPVKDKLTFEFDKLEEYSIKIFNTTGSLFLSKTTSSKRLEIDLDGLKSGVYIVKVNSSKRSVTKRIIKH